MAHDQFPLVAHIPSKGIRNLQRTVLLDLIKKETGHEPPPTLETEWRLLQKGETGTPSLVS